MSIVFKTILDMRTFVMRRILNFKEKCMQHFRVHLDIKSLAAVLNSKVIICHECFVVVITDVEMRFSQASSLSFDSQIIRDVLMKWC